MMELWKQNGSMSPASARSCYQQHGTKIYYTCDHDAHDQSKPYHTKQGNCQNLRQPANIRGRWYAPCASAQGHTNTLFLLTLCRRASAVLTALSHPRLE